MDFHTVNKRPMDGGLLTCDIAKALHVQTQNSNTGIYKYQLLITHLYKYGLLWAYLSKNLELI